MTFEENVEEFYLDKGSYQYGLMDINNPIETEDGIKYNVSITNGSGSLIVSGLSETLSFHFLSIR